MSTGKETGKAGGGGHVIPVLQTAKETIGLAESARRRAIVRHFDKTYPEWKESYRTAVGNSEGLPQRRRLKQALALWQGTGCELCTCFQDYAAADDHAMEDCIQWEESSRAKHLLRLLGEVVVNPAPKEKYGAIDEENDVSCTACGFASKSCHIEGPDAAPGADCCNVEAAKRAVAALLAFEDGLLVDGLVEVPWLKDDDAAAMRAWMAEQAETDRSYTPGILQALDDLYGSYQYLIKDYDYRANFRRLGKGRKNVPALPRCGNGKVEFLEDKFNAEVAAKEEKVAAIEKQLDEQDGDDNDALEENDEDSENGYDSNNDDEDLENDNYDSEDDEDWDDDDDSEEEDDLDDELLSLTFDIELLERWRPITHRLTQLQRLLLRYRDTCVVCKAADRQFNHSIRTCTDEKARKAQVELAWAERAIYFDRDLGCFRCGVPSQVCSRWEDEERGQELFRLIRLPGRCCFEGVTLETIYGIKYGYEAIWISWLGRLEGKGVHVRHTLSSEQAEENLMTYLSKRNEDDLVKEKSTNPNSNNLMWEFEWIALEVEKGFPTVK